MEKESRTRAVESAKARGFFKCEYVAFVEGWEAARRYYKED
jgi:hypothetical protein